MECMGGRPAWRWKGTLGWIAWQSTPMMEPGSGGEGPSWHAFLPHSPLDEHSPSDESTGDEHSTPDWSTSGGGSAYCRTASYRTASCAASLLITTLHVGNGYMDQAEPRRGLYHLFTIY